MSVIAYHVDGVAHGALYEALKELKSTGKFEQASKMLLPNGVQARLVRSDDYNALARKYHMIK